MQSLQICRHYCRSLAGTTPVYLADKCTLVTAAGRRPLRSADNRTCLVKRSHNQFGDRCFATARPTLWNSLPEQLRQPDITFGQFKQSLKTILCLVSWAAAPCVWTLRALTRNVLTYLLTYLLTIMYWQQYYKSSRSKAVQQTCANSSEEETSQWYTSHTTNLQVHH